VFFGRIRPPPALAGLRHQSGSLLLGTSRVFFLKRHLLCILEVDSSVVQSVNCGDSMDQVCYLLSSLQYCVDQTQYCSVVSLRDISGLCIICNSYYRGQ